MFELNNILPFSSVDFFYFMLISIGLMHISKNFLSKIIPYKWVLVFINLIYIALLFTKPLQIIGLILFLYFGVLGLRKWYKNDNIVFPMLLLSFPIFIMKYVNIIPEEESSELIFSLKDIFQIAGLSYMVFKVISLYIDERSSKQKINFLAFFNYTAFVPTLLIGPLDKFQRFNKDVAQGYTNLNNAFAIKAWDNLIKGLLFKFIIAEAIRRLVLNQIIADDSILYHTYYMYTYLFYLFFDFAGYSLLAISFGQFLGINVPINFDKPFLATNPKEFWKKWHKSLGDWLGDYFFKPLFKLFTKKKIYKSIQRQNIALFLTFTLMGFWNGFELHYIASGVLFGLYSVLHNYYVYRCKKTKKDVFFGTLSEQKIKYISIFIMFNAVAFAIYIFSGNLF